MTNLTVHNIRVDNYGTVEPHFSEADGRVFRLPTVGRIWKYENDNQCWSAKATVVESKYHGLLRFSPFKSRCATPLKIAKDEVYLPVSVTGRSLRFDTLPTLP